MPIGGPIVISSSVIPLPPANVLIPYSTSSFISSDYGVTWSTATGVSANMITYSPALGMWVTAAATGTTSQLKRSTDNGTTWTVANNIPFTNTSYGAQSVAWSDTLNLFVAVGSQSGTDYTHGAATSSDGATWTTQVTPTATGNDPVWRTVLWAPFLGVFIAGSGSGGQLMTSPDGTNWTQQTSPNTGYSFEAKGAVSNTQAALNTNGRLVYTNDGVNFTVVTDTTLGTNVTGSSVAYGNGKWCMCRSTGSYVASDASGPWTANTSAFASGFWRYTAFAADQFIAFDINNDAGSQVAYSSDGLNWTVTTTPNQYINATDIGVGYT